MEVEKSEKVVGTYVEYGSFPSRFGSDWTALYRIGVRAKSRFKVLTPLDPRVSPIPPALAQLVLSFGRAGWREAATVIEGVYNGLRQQTDGERRPGRLACGEISAPLSGLRPAVSAEAVASFVGVPWWRREARPCQQVVEPRADACRFAGTGLAGRQRGEQREREASWW
ncbi:hypothetical protein BC567DRAFT_217976 [Phyllosticta citribraziliensis]